MSRNTVGRLLELSEAPRYERAAMRSKLDPHRGSIGRLLDVNPKVPATVIIEYLRRDGCQGGITILKDYLVQVRPLFVQARSYQRTSYLPGEVGHNRLVGTGGLGAGGTPGDPGGVRVGDHPAALGGARHLVLLLQDDGRLPTVLLGHPATTRWSLSGCR